MDKTAKVWDYYIDVIGGAMHWNPILRGQFKIGNWSQSVPLFFYFIWLGSILGRKIRSIGN